MRKNIFLLLGVLVSSLFFTTGCFDKTSHSGDSIISDSILADSVLADSISEVVEDTPMPVAADELFDDFFFNFAANRKVQKERIKFPLVVDNFGKKSTVKHNQWRRERFFMSQGYYCLIFNKYTETALVKDTTVCNATVERISMSKKVVTRWHFSRIKGLWYMNNVRKMSLAKHPDAKFLKFYQHFATDSAFQQRSLCDPVMFTGPDPDDDFSTMTGELMPEQWPMFAPWLPSGTFFNIIYGSESYPDTDFRLMMLRGISNGMQMELQFVKQDGQWRLKKINT